MSKKNQTSTARMAAQLAKSNEDYYQSCFAITRGEEDNHCMTNIRMDVKGQMIDFRKYLKEFRNSVGDARLIPCDLMPSKNFTYTNAARDGGSWRWLTVGVACLNALPELLPHMENVEPDPVDGDNQALITTGIVFAGILGLVGLGIAAHQFSLWCRNRPSRDKERAPLIQVNPDVENGVRPPRR
ncbi:MAG: hypothetical protein SFW66_05060 [Gammaproteobacteria bacterium]|nr:hypothetical protein [Gammaproteobacteria bacterium]